MIVEEKHASEVNISQYMLNNQKYGRVRKASALDKAEVSSQQSNDTIKQEKKKVHFVRSHTPKPVKSKAMREDEMNDFITNRFLSPMRQENNSYQKGDHHYDPKRHGDVLTRSSMYSSVKCPFCERMFAEAAALRHIPICQTIIHKPKRLDEKQHPSHTPGI